MNLNVAYKLGDSQISTFSINTPRPVSHSLAHLGNRATAPFPNFQIQT